MENNDVRYFYLYRNNLVIREVNNDFRIEFHPTPIGCIARTLVKDNVVFGWSACSKKDTFNKVKARAISTNRLNKVAQLLAEDFEQAQAYQYGGMVSNVSEFFVDILADIVENCTPIPKHFRQAAIFTLERLAEMGAQEEEEVEPVENGNKELSAGQCIK